MHKDLGKKLAQEILVIRELAGIQADLLVGFLQLSR